MQSWAARPGYREITVAPVTTASWMFEIESSGWRPYHMIRTSHPWSAGPLVTVTSVRAKALLRLGHSQTDDSACYTEGLSSDFQVLDRYTKHCKQPWTRSLSWPPRQRSHWQLQVVGDSVPFSYGIVTCSIMKLQFHYIHCWAGLVRVPGVTD
jgi:hypothetical protein